MNIRVKMVFPLIFLAIIVIPILAVMPAGQTMNLPPSRVTDVKSLLEVFDNNGFKIAEA